MFASPKQLNPIADWHKSGEHIELCIAIDIGGSGLRVRICNAINTKEFLDLGHVRAQGTQEAISVFNNLGETLKECIPSFVCKSAALAVAGPISNGRVVLTNWAGEPESRTLVADELPEIIFPRGKTLFLNDLEAGAYGIIAAQESGILEKHFEQMWTHKAPKGKIVSDSRTAVLAMGSGLGVALIVKSDLLESPLVVPTELGHMQIPVVCKNDPTSELEYELVQHVSNHYYGGKQTPEFEDISSGRGLCLAYQFFKLKNESKRIPVEQINAGDVAEAARTGDKTARQALEWHYKIFIRSAKAVATSLTCDSLILALDNQVKNGWFVNAIADVLHDEFYNFIRPDWMNGIRVYTQIETLNFNILGTHYMANKVANQ
ncbi:putative glucokinase 2 [Tritrichomonas foetus]|uniref:Glucokinase 2 n=1 Tax=Tritrichomonas foetus TaxID=1144522 RepID=A0A1J4K4K4_9EUKA|nr:putative glucokinase 2 [Tritrichomonas foetus]|eukprot:OHT04429.1 putative glucokinase 2 [Tritrichomonas foetus]